MCDFRCEYITLHIKIIGGRWWRGGLGGIGKSRRDDEIVVVIRGRGKKEVNNGGKEEKAWGEEEEGAVDEAVTRRRRGKDKAGVGGSKVERDTRIKTKKKIIKKIVIDQYY